MKAVTHNIKHTLGLSQTKKSVRRALTTKPQIVSFQEFDPQDNEALIAVKKNYHILQPNGSRGLPVLLRKKYVRRIVDQQTLVMSKGSDGVRTTPATQVLFVNRYGTRIAVLNTHPVAHHERPEYKKHFGIAINSIENWAQDVSEAGYVPMLMMDGNGADKIRGLVSCWEGNHKLPTGPGGRTIDGTWTAKNAYDVHTFGSPSDHNGVVAYYHGLR